MQLTISFSAILMACLGFLGVYILMPVALIFRDVLILKVVSKFILNTRFWTALDENSEAKAYINKFLAGKTLEKGFFSSSEPWGDRIDGKIVSDSESKNFENQWKKYNSIVNETTPYLQRRINYVVWIDQYFKTQANFEAQINKRTEEVYNKTLKKLGDKTP